MKDAQKEPLLQVARSFESIIGKPVPFVIAIWNEDTERIEFVTNMEKAHMETFIDDIADQVRNPVTYETYKRDEGLQ